MSVRVLAPGLLTTVQDRGRFSHAAIGVGTAGAMDGVALRLANALVGNDESAAALELTLRGPRLGFENDAIIALAGAEFDVRCAGEVLPPWRPLLVRGGAELDCGGARRGARAYLAIAGGIAVAPVLGSRSSDVNSALGPMHGRALLSGDILPIAARPIEDWPRRLRAPGTRPEIAHADGHAAWSAAHWSIDPAPWFDAAAVATIAIVRGAHFDRLGAPSRRALFAAEFRVGNDSNRVGYRLEGANLALADPLELISESVVPGTVQLPPNGQPIVLMAEAPTTGGYPRIAHVAAVDLPRLAQCRPGDRVRFVETSLAGAQTRYLERESALGVLARSIRERVLA